MKRTGKDILDFLLFSNLFVALAAVGFTVETMLLLGIPLAWHPYVFIAFFATLFDYCLHRYIGYKKQLPVPDADQWIHRHSLLFYSILVISFSGLIVSLFFAKPEVILFLVPMAAITFSYTLPVFKRKGKLYRFIDLPVLKTLLITLVWSLTTVLLPVIQDEIPVFHKDVILLFAGRFFFVFALAIPFDIRDSESDARAGLRTLPVLIGNTASRILAYFSLLLFCLCEMITRHDALSVSFALILSAIISGVVIAGSRRTNHPWYYYGLIDGMIILQVLLVSIVFLID